MLNSDSRMKEKRTEGSRVWLFDAMAADYDAWFEEIGKTIFDIEVQAFRGVLPLLPKPWLAGFRK